MLTVNQNQVTEDVTADSIEVLRQILSKQQHRPVDYGEAQEIGDSLIEFYKLLVEVITNDSAE